MLQDSLTVIDYEIVSVEPKHIDKDIRNIKSLAPDQIWKLDINNQNIYEVTLKLMFPLVSVKQLLFQVGHVPFIKVCLYTEYADGSRENICDLFSDILFDHD